MLSNQISKGWKMYTTEIMTEELRDFAKRTEKSFGCIQGEMVQANFM